MKILFLVLSMLPLVVSVSRKFENINPPQPPAGRVFLYRPAHLQPWDFPGGYIGSDHHLQYENRPLGPKGFWTKESLHKHYLATRHIRYDPNFYPNPPPFEDWLKEQQLIRTLALHRLSMELDMKRDGSTPGQALEHVLVRSELSVLLRQLQIATAKKYAKLDPRWFQFEEAVYKMWAPVVKASQEQERGDRLYAGEWGKEHMAYVNELNARGKLKRERAEQQRLEAFRVNAQQASGRRNDGRDKGKRISDEGVGVERMDLQSTTPPRWTHTPVELLGSKGVPHFPAQEAGPSNYAMSLSGRMPGAGDLNEGRADLRSTAPTNWINTPDPVRAKNLREGLEDALPRFHL